MSDGEWILPVYPPVVVVFEPAKPVLGQLSSGSLGQKSDILLFRGIPQVTAARDAEKMMDNFMFTKLNVEKDGEGWTTGKRLTSSYERTR